MNTSSSWSSTSTSSESSRGRIRFSARRSPRSPSSSCSSKLAGGVSATPSSAASSSSSGYAPGHHLDDPPGLGAGQRSPPERRHEPGSDHRRLAAPARADDGEKASPVEAVDQVRGQHLASEEVGGVRLLKRTQTFVRVPRLQAHADLNGHGPERAPERDVLRKVRELWPDVHHANRIDQTLEPDRAALDVFDAIHLAGQVRDLAADEDLRGSRRGRTVERQS